MNRAVSWCSLIAAATVVVVLSVSAPDVLSNKNEFLAGFMPHEFLTIVGVMLTITLASAAQVHLKLNEIEENHKRVFLVKTRSNVRSATYALIIMFLLCVLLVVVRPFAKGHDCQESLLNGGGLFLLFWTTLIMLSLTQLIFAIKPDIIED